MICVPASRLCGCAQILGKAYQAPQDLIISGQQIPKDHWLVEAQFYQLKQTSQRGYVLLSEKIQLNVNSLVTPPDVESVPWSHGGC